MCATREGHVLSLRLQGAGFRSGDAAKIVALWEAGRTRADLVDAATELGYGPVANLESVLEGVAQRKRPEPG